MNTTPFYELHDRLYDRASAGCASIAEDFRLKRAVETWLPSRKPTRRSRGSGTCARSSSRSLSLRCSSPNAMKADEVRLYALRGGATRCCRAK